MPFAQTPAPPYVAVIFTSVRSDGDDGYAAMAAAMDRSAYLGGLIEFLTR